jgi:ATP-dependent DNA ligase
VALPRITAADLMHPRIQRESFTGAGWVFEHKLDGFRALAIVEAGDTNCCRAMAAL